MLRKDFELCVVVNGNQVKEYEHNGSVFIEGKSGTDFSIRLKNNTHRRALAVPTIDGKSVIDGSTGSIDASGGYVVAPYSAITIPGWRINDEEIAKFVFTNKDGSYSAQIGDGTDNVGVIGCAFFYENEHVIYNSHITHTTWIYPQSPLIWWTSSGSGTIPCGSDGIIAGDVNLKSTSRSASIDNSSNTKGISDVADINHTTLCSCQSVNDACYSTEAVNNLGTGFGQQAAHGVTNVSFNRCSNPEVVFTMYYDTRDGLVNRGVSLQPKVQVCPSPFPASKGKGCPVPPGWGNKSSSKKDECHPQTKSASNGVADKSQADSEGMERIISTIKKVYGEKGLKAIEKELKSNR
jgi:hypothetical protein